MYSLEILVLSVAVAAFFFYKVKKYRTRYVELEAQRLGVDYDVTKIDYEALNMDYKASKYRAKRKLQTMHCLGIEDICAQFCNTYRTMPVTQREVESAFSEKHEYIMSHPGGYGPMQMKIMIGNSEFLSGNMARILQRCNQSMGLNGQDFPEDDGDLDCTFISWRECLGLHGKDVSLQDISQAYDRLKFRKTSEPKRAYDQRMSRLEFAAAQARAEIN